MAFGMEVGSKLFLSLFRIVAVVFLSWWMLKIKNVPKSLRDSSFAWL